MKQTRSPIARACLIVAALAAASYDAAAADPAAAPSDSQFSYSGFATIAAGRTFGRCQTSSSFLVGDYGGDACTRYVADWSHHGVYTPRWSFSPESRAGIQLTDQVTPDLSGTVQITARAVRDQTLNLEWAYLTYKLSPEWTVEVGRKRLPLFYYSDFQDIGYAYSTVRPPPDVYGWDIVNYNGASLAYNTEVSGWSLRSEVYGGAEHSRNNPYSNLTYATEQRIDWNDILGAGIEVSRDWFTGRLNYTAIKFRQVDSATGPMQLYNGQDAAAQHFLGLALNADIDAWSVRSEVGEALRQTSGYKSWFYAVSAGYRFGKLTPTLGWSSYRESTPFPDSYHPGYNTTATAALRYEIQKSAAVKLQINRIQDKSATTSLGSGNAVSASYDIVF